MVAPVYNNVLPSLPSTCDPSKDRSTCRRGASIARTPAELSFSNNSASTAKVCSSSTFLCMPCQTAVAAMAVHETAAY